MHLAWGCGGALDLWRIHSIVPVSFCQGLTVSLEELNFNKLEFIPNPGSVGAHFLPYVRGYRPGIALAERGNHAKEPPGCFYWFCSETWSGAVGGHLQFCP